MATYMREQGFAVETAADGEEALAALRGGLEPCLILLDLRMPRMSGKEFREHQLRDPRLAHIPVAVFSGDTHEAVVAAQLGIRDHLKKPIDFDALFAVLQRHCQRVTDVSA